MITTMEYRTIKIWTSTYHNLRLLAALTGESMLAALARLVADELKRVQRERNSGGLKEQEATDDATVI
jgi:hypothetical protein